jgi:hypothetical protein
VSGETVVLTNTLSDVTGTVAEAAAGGTDAATPDGAVQLSDQTSAATASADGSTGSSYVGGGRSTNAWSLSQRSGDDRIAVLVRLDRGLRGGAVVPSVENPDPCPDTASLLCELAISLSGAGSLAGSLASIIRYLAFTGFGLLPWIAATFIMTAAGALALTEARRRSARSLVGST